MENSSVLKRLDNDKLIDIVKNYRQYEYDNDIRDTAIALLIERGWSIDELKMFGHLDNHNYDIALNEFNAYRRNVKIAYAILFLSLGTLAIISTVFIFLAYRNQERFYSVLGKKNESAFIADGLGVMFYFHKRNRMKEQLKGIS